MTSRPAAAPARGVLVSQPVPGRHLRLLPSADLSAFVEHFWLVDWRLANAPAQTVETLPHPSVHMVFEHGKPAELIGVHKRRFTRTLTGNGGIFGVKFRPGGFYPLWQRPVIELVDRRLPLSIAFGHDGKRLAQAIAETAGDEQRMQLVETFLRQRLPEPDTNIALVERIAASVMNDPSLFTVTELAAKFELNTRALQRLFQRYVGISPKWMIQRYRLHDALMLLTADSEPNWSVFALTLGYSDQAHFIRDFKALIGRTPVDYWQLCQSVKRGKLV